MGKISGSHCLVLGCRNRQLLNQTNTRSYFRFPRDAELCKKWVDFCSRPELYKKYDENGPEYLYKSSRICSDHFQPTDFNNPNLFSQGLKKGSIPTVNPATHETKSNNGTGVGTAGGGGSGSSNGAGSPIDEKLLSAVASIPNLSANLSLMVAAAVHAAQQSHQQQQQQQQLLQANSALNATNLKRSAAAMSGSGGGGGGSAAAALQQTTASGTTPTSNSSTTTPSSGSSSAKRNRAVPPLATPTGALANLIQRHQQMKEQQIKEQQRKAALGGSGLVNGQVSITSVPGARTSPTNTTSRAGPISLVTSKKSAANNNNNNVSHHNHNHKANHEQQKHDQSDFGLNMNDTDMTGGESSEGDSSYQNSADEDYAYHQKQKVAKVEAVIPPSLKSQLTVTPATINNNTIHSTNGGALATSPTNGTINYKEKYEQTLKELFACRKIVKNQNKAIKQLQGEIDFLNQLLKEK